MGWHVIFLTDRTRKTSAKAYGEFTPEEGVAAEGQSEYRKD